MSLSSDLPLRDFDGESDETDSETELLIRHHTGSGGADGHHLTNTQPQHLQRSRHGSYSYSQNNKQTPSFLSQLFGVVGGTTKYLSSSRQTQQNLKPKQTPPPLLRSATASSLARDGQIRLRNEHSRERGQTATSNTTASQSSINNAAQAVKFARSNSKSYNLNFPNDPLGTVGSNVASSGSFHYSDSLQMSNMDTQPNITTTTSPNGVMQTVIDPENGSTTVFYQKNRRKSKKRSFGNLCKMCLCG